MGKEITNNNVVLTSLHGVVGHRWCAVQVDYESILLEKREWVKTSEGGRWMLRESIYKPLSTKRNKRYRLQRPKYKS